ncbi:hypothetical protein ACLOJK_001368 [Asimina triloba]
MESSPRMDAPDGDDDASDDDLGLDDSFDEDMEALKRACMLTGANPESIQPPSTPSAAACGPNADSCSDTDDDLELVRSIQQRFYLPSVSINGLKSWSTGTLLESDDEDDFETLRAIQRRFVQYDAGDVLYENVREEVSTLHGFMCHTDKVGEKPLQTVGITAEESASNTLVGNKNNGEALGEDFPDSDDAHANSQHLQYFCNRSDGSQPTGVTEKHPPEDGTPNLSLIPFRNTCLPASAQLFITALKKNRSCQKLIRSKLIQMEARIEENKELRRRFKHLLDFQVACKKRAGKVLSQPKDPRIEAVLEKFPVSLRRQPWSKVERENLAKGIKQQFQEMLLQKSIENYSEEGSSGVSNVDRVIASINDLGITPENMRSFLPHVDWERLASMYVMGRSGAECQTRWLNNEDPMVNHNPWDKLEDKNLLFLCQNRGIYNWIEIAALLGTNRTPCQCLARYQRSLNAFILKRDWTEEEDVQLCAVVETVGENDWQRVASILGGRTGPQCSNRWLKTLHPSRKRVGRWAPDEDKRLKIAVMLFGQKTWKKIAQFVPGRTQVQCRERWVNTLDPSLNLEPWTEEEDTKLKTAIAEHGYCWSKIAAMNIAAFLLELRVKVGCVVLGRWKVLFPHEVPLLQAERRIQKVALIANFVDREEQRSTLSPSDFVAAFALEMNPISEGGGEDNSGKRKMKTRDDLQLINTKVSKRKAANCKETKVTKKRERKRPARTEAQAHPHRSLRTSEDNDAKTLHDITPMPKKRKKQSRPKLVTDCDRSIHPLEGHGDQQHSKHSLLEVGRSVDASLEGSYFSGAVEDASQDHPSKKMPEGKACQKELMNPPDHDDMVLASGSCANGKVAVSDKCGVWKAEDSSKEGPSREWRCKHKALQEGTLDELNSDDNETLISFVHKQLKRRRGDKHQNHNFEKLPARKRNKQVSKIIPDRDSHTQLSVLDMVDTTSNSLAE